MFYKLLENKMPQFQTIEQAFEWFLESVYPNLPTEKKTSTLRGIKHAYYSEGEKVSEKRMKRVLAEYCNYEVIHNVEEKL
ncbi:MAG TPA: hypothetical protein DCS93_38730 [Microscillaceae bacterium]|nr:hypothetical protein [Microscillaceae bacterium]